MLLLNHNKLIKGHVTEQEQALFRTALTPGTEAFEKQQSILNRWREAKLWVQCDCKDAEAEFSDRPIMCLRRLTSGLIIFAILPSSQPHAVSCPFFRIIKYKQYENGQRLKQNRRRTDFMFHRHSIEKTDEPNNDEDTEPKKPSPPSMPGLQRFIYNLAHQSGIHVFTEKTQLKQRAYLFRIQKCAEEFTINKRFRLSDYLYFSPLQQPQAIHRLKVTEKYWTGAARAHCVFIFPIDEIVKDGQGTRLRRLRFDEEHELQAEEMILPKECELLLPGSMPVNQPNPCLAVVTLADVSETTATYYAPAKALVVPVVSLDHLMIIENHYERVVASSLRACQMFLSQRQKVQFHIRVVKPLDNLRAPISGQACRPDFVLEINNRKIILQVLGSHDDEYLEQKRRFIPIMEELAPVYEFDALKASQDQELEKRAGSAAREALTLLLKDDPLFSKDIWDEMKQY